MKVVEAAPGTPAHVILIRCRALLELSLDGNPLAEQNGVGSIYRRHILERLPGLHHLDLKRVTGHDQALQGYANRPDTIHHNRHRSSAGNSDNRGSIGEPDEGNSSSNRSSNGHGLPILTKGDNSSGHVDASNHRPRGEDSHHWVSENKGNVGHRSRIGAATSAPRPPTGASGSNRGSSPSQDASSTPAACVGETVEQVGSGSQVVGRRMLGGLSVEGCRLFPASCAIAP